MACSKHTAPTHHRAPTPPRPCRSGELRLTHQGIHARSGAPLGVNHDPENFSLSPTWPLLDRVTGCCRAPGPPQWRRTPLRSFDGRQQMWEWAGGMGRQMEAPSFPVGPSQGPLFQGLLTSCLDPGPGVRAPLENLDGLGVLLCIKMALAAASSLATRFSHSLALSLIRPARTFALLFHLTPPSHPRVTPASRPCATLSCPRTRIVSRLSSPAAPTPHATRTPARPPRHVPPQHLRHGAYGSHQRRP